MKEVKLRHPRKYILHNGKAEFVETCQITNKEYKVVVPFEDFRRWREDKELAHKVFDYLDADEREFIISGFTPEEFKHITS